MVECKLCKNAISMTNPVCELCDFNFESESIGDEYKCKMFHTKLKKEYPWYKEVEFLSRLQKLTRLSNARMSRLLGIKSRSILSRDLPLAQGVATHPELKNIPSKSKAFKRLRNLSSKQIYMKEEELQKKIYTAWDQTFFADEWFLFEKNDLLGQYDTGEVGIMDLLAHNHKRNKWLVVELKQDSSSDDTVGQILRYMGWVKKNLAKQNHIVEGVIVCGSYDIQMEYALSCLPSVGAYIYRLRNNEIEFWPYKDGFGKAMQALENLDPKIRKKVLKNMY